MGGEWTPIEWPDNVHIFTSFSPEEKSYFKEDKLAASIYGFSYPARAVTSNQASRYRVSTDAPFHIGMLHGTLSGAEGHDPYAPFTYDDLEKAGWIIGRLATFINGRCYLLGIRPLFTPEIFKGGI